MFEYGIIGTGHMGAELARCIAKEGHSLLLANRTPEKAESLAKELNATAGTNEEVCQKAKFIFLGVRPQSFDELCAEISPILKKRNDYVLVSMAVGLSIETILKKLDLSCPVIRIMPNTPVSVGEGVILYTLHQVSKTDEQAFCSVFSSNALLVPLAEEAIDAAGCISGCGPAFVYQFIDAFAKAGESLGLSQNEALELVLKTIQGSVKMVQTTGETPRSLCDKVCSKGGTTERGVFRIDDANIDKTMKEALKASYDRTLELKK